MNESGGGASVTPVFFWEAAFACFPERLAFGTVARRVADKIDDEDHDHIRRMSTKVVLP